MLKTKISYNESYKNNFKNDVKEAVNYYLNLHNNSDSEYINGFILYPQALNPFLKVMETMKEIKNFMIIPTIAIQGLNENYSKIDESSYLIIKFPESNFSGQWIEEIQFGDTAWSDNKGISGTGYAGEGVLFVTSNKVVITPDNGIKTE